MNPALRRHRAYECETKCSPVEKYEEHCADACAPVVEKCAPVDKCAAKKGKMAAGAGGIVAFLFAWFTLASFFWIIAYSYDLSWFVDPVTNVHDARKNFIWSVIFSAIVLAVLALIGLAVWKN